MEPRRAETDLYARSTAILNVNLVIGGGGGGDDDDNINNINGNFYGAVTRTNRFKGAVKTELYHRYS